MKKIVILLISVLSLLVMANVVFAELKCEQPAPNQDCAQVIGGKEVCEKSHGIGPVPGYAYQCHWDVQSGCFPGETCCGNSFIDTNLGEKCDPVNPPAPNNGCPVETPICKDVPGPNECQCFAEGPEFSRTGIIAAIVIVALVVAWIIYKKKKA